MSSAKEYHEYFVTIFSFLQADLVHNIPLCWDVIIDVILVHQVSGNKEMEKVMEELIIYYNKNRSKFKVKAEWAKWKNATMPKL